MMARVRVADDHELRCAGTLHGVRRQHQGHDCIEFKCHHIACTKGRAVAVFHYFSLKTGDIVDTVIYRNDPIRNGHKL